MVRKAVKAVVMSLRMSEQTYLKLRAEAERIGMSLSEFVRYILTVYIESREESNR